MSESLIWTIIVVALLASWVYTGWRQQRVINSKRSTDLVGPVKTPMSYPTTETIINLGYISDQCCVNDVRAAVASLLHFSSDHQEVFNIDELTEQVNEVRESINSDFFVRMANMDVNELMASPAFNVFVTRDMSILELMLWWKVFGGFEHDDEVLAVAINIMDTAINSAATSRLNVFRNRLAGNEAIASEIDDFFGGDNDDD